MEIIRDEKKISIITILEDREKATIFQHFKGQDYSIITIGYDADNLEKLVVYQALYDDKKVWVRKYDEFFSETDKKKYPDVKQKYRFEIKEM